MDLTDGRILPASNDAICVPKPKVCAAELGIKSTPAVHRARISNQANALLPLSSFSSTSIYSALSSNLQPIDQLISNVPPKSPKTRMNETF